MATATSIKRQNFNVSTEEEAELNRLREILGAPSIKDAIMRSARVVLTLSREISNGNRIFATEPGGAQCRILLADLESTSASWTYLAPRPHAWKRQLYVKGRKLTAANVWLEMLTNHMTPAETADNWDLPIEAIEEIIRYCELHRQLIKMESAEERRILLEAGVSLTPGSAK